MDEKLIYTEFVCKECKQEIKRISEFGVTEDRVTNKPVLFFVAKCGCCDNKPRHYYIPLALHRAYFKVKEVDL